VEDTRLSHVTVKSLKRTWIPIRVAISSNFRWSSFRDVDLISLLIVSKVPFRGVFTFPHVLALMLQARQTLEHQNLMNKTNP
jgi:hypothetical protein